MRGAALCAACGAAKTRRVRVRMGVSGWDVWMRGVGRELYSKAQAGGLLG